MGSGRDRGEGGEFPKKQGKVVVKEVIRKRNDRGRMREEAGRRKGLKMTAEDGVMAGGQEVVRILVEAST